jgi:hypothetical protein
MEMDIPDGVSAVTLTYDRTRLDWLMLLMALLGLLGVAGLVVRPNMMAGSQRDTGSFSRNGTSQPTVEAG